MLFSAPILGLAGSLHCMGMCGPLALAAHARNLPAWKAALLYHSGRSLSYMGLGALAGLAGNGLFASHLQYNMGILAGLLMVAWGLAYLIPSRKSLGYPSFWRKAAGRLMGKKHPASLLALGAVNGLLPCGLLWAALAGASIEASWWGGLAFMGIFALSTWPAMMGISVLRDWLQPWIKKRQMLIACWLLLSGGWLIFRSEWLQAPTEGSTIPVCHSPNSAETNP